ncbi:glutamyl-tRNA reductase [Edaphobacter sp. HDX4]|uniref:glutamyl-tRNA reductase n=1 Tax=Edaphobacter sp. HDX4 TaxID=2794064 RepID=UPI002FE5C3E3
MKILLQGLNHKTAPLELREQLAIEPAELTDATRSLLHLPGVREAMLLFTCNRVEVVVCHDTDVQTPLQFLGDHLGIAGASFAAHSYEYRDFDAVQHLFRVASSLDSMIVGEPQILGQVKEAYAAARSIGTARSHLERLMQATFAAAKKVRSQTGIGNASVSIASVAVDLAARVFGSLKGQRVLLVGAGKMGELAAAQFISQGAQSVLVANRTHENAVRLASTFGGRAVPFEDLYTAAAESDIVLTSTGAQEYIFRREHGREFLRRRKNKPMFLIDIAVPRDVDPALNSIDGIFLHDIDSLQSVASAHLEERKIEAQRAERIVAQEALGYHRRTQTLDIGPVVRELHEVAEQIREAELCRAQSQMLPHDQRAAIEGKTRRMMNKFLHPVIMKLKSAAEQGDVDAITTIRTTFDQSLVQQLRSQQGDKKTVEIPPPSRFNALTA